MSEIPQHNDEPLVPKLNETKEAKNRIEAEVFGPCETEGENVGLGEKQRKELGVNISDVVVVRDENGKRLGFFTVVKISKEALKEKKITANVSAGKISMEKVEEAPAVTFVVAGKHLNSGNVVGLTHKQRKLMGLKEGEKVRLQQSGKDLGEFEVGKGNKDHINQSNLITANLPEGVEGEITVVKITA